MQSPDYVAVNPRGWVPMIVDGETRVTETPAICLYLADRYGYGTLAPRLEEPARGPYMSWTVWATAVLEPASTLDGHEIATKRRQPGASASASWSASWRCCASVLAAGATGSLGERFTAADVMVGSSGRHAALTGEMPAPSRPWSPTAERCEARPAYQRAANINWPKADFAPRESGA